MKKLKISMILSLFIVLSACNKDRVKKAENENEREIQISELPVAVKDGINEKFTGAELIEADEIKHPDGSITYDVEIKYNSKEIEVMYDSAGKYLGTEADDEDENDHDEDRD